MKIVCASDVHGMLASVDLPPGDVLVLAGDILGNFSRNAAQDAALQLERLPAWKRPEATLPGLVDFLDKSSFRHVVLVAGNHDWAFQLHPDKARSMLPAKVHYLEDSGAVIDGVSFHGTPWQPEFCGWAFNLPRDGSELAAKWAKIPEGVDVLVTHGPPLGILDLTPRGEHVGCALLRDRIIATRPRFSVFGHIHDGYGAMSHGLTTYVNVSTCDESYRPVNPPRVIVIEGTKALVLP